MTVTVLVSLKINRKLVNLKIISFGTGDREHAYIAFGIRRIVFVDEQKVDASLEYDHEEEATHYLVFEDEIPVATGRWRKTTEGIKLNALQP